MFSKARQILQTHILTFCFCLTFFMFEQTNQSEQFWGFLLDVFVFPMLDKSCISDMCKHMGQHCHLMATALHLYWHLHWCLLLLDSILSPLFLALKEENEEQRMHIWCVKKCWWTQDPESMMLDTWDVSGLECYSTAIVELLWYFLQKFSSCVAQYEFGV